MSTEIIVLSQCEKELKKFPVEVLNDFLDAIAKLKNGLTLSMPLSKAMGSIYGGLHELRIRDRSGIYRVFYYYKKNDALYVIHAFKKTTQKTPSHTIELILGRLRTIK